MTRDEMILVSVDDHVIEPPTLFENRVPRKWAEREELWEHFELAHCSDAEIAKVTHQNALRWFGFDPFRFVPKAEATVGALRARAADVDIRTRSRAEYRAAYEALHGPIG